MKTKLTLTGARVNDDATNIVLTGAAEDGRVFDVEFDADDGEVLLAAFTSALGQRARLQTGDNTLMKVLPLEWWQINPHPDRDGLLLSFRMPGGMEMTFHLDMNAVPVFEEVLTALTGTRLPETPPGLKN